MNKQIGQAAPEQINEWKNQYGELYAVRVDGHVAYLRKPTRKALSYASNVGKNDPLKFNEALLKECFVGGSDAVKSDDMLFLSVGAKLSELVQVKEAELEKL